MIACPRSTVIRALIGIALVAGLAIAGPAAAAGPVPRVFPPYVPAPGESARTAADRSFDRLVDTWFAEEAQARPTWATGRSATGSWC